MPKNFECTTKSRAKASNAPKVSATTWRKKLPRTMLLGVSAVCVMISTSVFAGVVPEQAITDADAGYFRRALTQIEPLLGAHAKDAELQYRYGQALLGIGKTEMAVNAFKTAIELEPKNGVYHRSLGEAFGTQAQRSGMFSALGLVKSARKEFELAVQLAPQDLQSHVMLASFYIMAPGVVGGSYDKAHVHEDIIDKLDEIEGLKVRATEAGSKDDIATGETLLNQAIAKDKTAKSQFALALLYSGAKQYDKAFKAFRVAQAKDPKIYAAWYQIGRVAVIAKTNYDEGVAALKHYLAFDDLPDNVPTPAWAHFRLGNLYALQGHKDLARTEFRVASTMNENDERLAEQVKDALSDLD